MPLRFNFLILLLFLKTYLSLPQNQFSNIRPEDLVQNVNTNPGYSSGPSQRVVEKCVRYCSQFPDMMCDTNLLQCIKITRTVPNPFPVDPFPPNNPVTCGKNQENINNYCYCLRGCKEINNGRECSCCGIKRNSFYDKNNQVCKCKNNHESCPGFNPYDNSQIGCRKLNPCENFGAGKIGSRSCPRNSQCFLKRLDFRDGSAGWTQKMSAEMEPHLGLARASPGASPPFSPAPAKLPAPGLVFLIRI